MELNDRESISSRLSVTPRLLSHVSSPKASPPPDLVYPLAENQRPNTRSISSSSYLFLEVSP